MAVVSFLWRPAALKFERAAMLRLSRSSIAVRGKAHAINTLRGPARATADAVSANGPFVMGVS